jgi:hypothetical protein
MTANNRAYLCLTPSYGPIHTVVCEAQPGFSYTGADLRTLGCGLEQEASYDGDHTYRALGRTSWDNTVLSLQVIKESS